MSQIIADLLLMASAISGTALLTGLFKPWIALWWMPRQNRLMVIRWYGGIFVLALLCRSILQMFTA